MKTLIMFEIEFKNGAVEQCSVECEHYATDSTETDRVPHCALLDYYGEGQRAPECLVAQGFAEGRLSDLREMAERGG